MRILSIAGSNLASLGGRFLIALDQEPLAGAGLFAMTGPTGAGKSTLLDALSLALFDQVPRLPPRHDPRGLLRRGAGEGHAEVVFRGRDGCDYRSRWSVRRARGRADGNLQPAEMVLERLDRRERWAGSRTEVLAAISQRIGLTFEQFRRSVLLAQGEFAAFLKARADQRSELLELITGTVVYSKLSILAHERAREGRGALAGLEQAFAAVRPLADEVRAGLEAERAVLEQELAGAGEALALARAARAWHQTLMRLEHERAGAEAESDAAAAAVAAAESRRLALAEVLAVQPLRPLLAEAERTAAESAAAGRAASEAAAMLAKAGEAVAQAAADEAAALADAQAAGEARRAADPVIEEAAGLDRQGVELTTALAAATEDVAAANRESQRLTGEVGALTAALDQARAEHAEVAGRLAAAVMIAPVAAQWQRWEAEILRWGKAAQALDAARARLGELADGYAGVDAAAPLRAAAVREAAAALAASAAALDHARRQPAPGLEACRIARETAGRLVGGLEEAQRLVGEAGQLVDQRAAALADQDAAEGLADRERAAGEEAASAAAALQPALTEAELTLDRLRLAVRADVAALRRGLEPGVPCPVCGGVEHPWHRPKDLARPPDAPSAPNIPDVPDAGYPAGGLESLIEEQSERVRTLRVRLEGGRLEAARARAAADAASDRALAAADRIAGYQEALEQLNQRWAGQRAALPSLIEAVGGGGNDDTVDLDGWGNGGSDRDGRDEGGRDEGTPGDLAAVTLPACSTVPACTVPVWPWEPQAADQIAEALTLARRARDRAGEREAAALGHERRLQALDRQRQEDAERLNQAREAQDALTRERERLDAGRALAESARDHALGQQAASLTVLEIPLGGISGWGDQLMRDAEAFARGLAGRCAAWLRDHDRLAALERRMATLETEGQARRLAQTAAGERAAQLTARRQEVDARCRALAERRAALFEGRPVAGVRAALDGAVQAASARVAQTRSALDAARQATAAAAREVEMRRQQGDAARSAAAAAEAGLGEALAGQGLACETLRQRLGRNAAWINAEQTALRALDDQAAAARVRCEERTRRVADHQTAPPALTADQVTAARADAEARLARSQEQLTERQLQLRADDRRREQAGTLAEQLEEQRRAQAVWEDLARLIGSADGKKFRTFAQTVSLDLLIAHANHHLGVLARRYRLEQVRDGSLELQVIDRDLANDLRSVHSLSGGETFLVSLALALGLSSMTGGAAIGTLFIDEGFGALDADSLDQAVACLETLQASGRQVGVVSHIPALIERIGIQVKVSPLGGGRSQVRTVATGWAAGG